MACQIIITEAAEEDLRQAFLWYEQQREGLGLEFETTVNDAVDSIASNPFKTAIRYKTVRVFYLDRFPYGLHFTEQENTVTIIAAYHTSKSPENWKNR